MHYTDTRRQSSLDQCEEQTGQARSVDEADIDPARRSVTQHPHPALLFHSTEAAPISGCSAESNISALNLFSLQEQMHLGGCCFQMWAIDFAADPARQTCTKYFTIAVELALLPGLTKSFTFNY